jgi:hypothetical protein
MLLGVERATVTLIRVDLHERAGRGSELLRVAATPAHKPPGTVDAAAVIVAG